MSKVANFQTGTTTESGSYIYYAYLNHSDYRAGYTYATRSLAPIAVFVTGVLLDPSPSFVSSVIGSGIGFLAEVIAMVVGVLVCYKWWSTW